MKEASDKPDLESAEPQMNVGLAVDCTGFQGEAMTGINWIHIDEVPRICKQGEVEPMLIAALWGCECKCPLFHTEARESQ